MKFKLFFILALLPIFGHTQILQNIGFGTGGYEVEPLLLTDENGNKKFIGAVDIQFINFSYEPRITLVDSIFNQFSISAGLPVVIGYSHYDQPDSGVLGYGSAQAAIIGYLNWGNGTLRKNLYNRKLGLSLGFGMIYLHSGIIKREVDVRRPKNDRIKPVISYSLRYKTSQDVIMELNLLMRLKRYYSYEKCSIPTSPFEYPTCWQVGYQENGLLLQFKLFFGQ